MQTIMNEVCMRFKLVRDTLEWTQQQMADMLDTTQQTVYNIEKGQLVSARMRSRLNENLNVEENWLLFGKGEMFTEAGKPTYLPKKMKASDPWKDEAYTNLKKQNEFLQRQLDMLQQTVLALSGKLGKYKALEFPGRSQKSAGAYSGAAAA